MTKTDYNNNVGVSRKMPDGFHKEYQQMEGEGYSEAVKRIKPQETREIQLDGIANHPNNPVD